jgi:hypothetical protein
MMDRYKLAGDGTRPSRRDLAAKERERKFVDILVCLWIIRDSEVGGSEK